VPQEEKTRKLDDKREERPFVQRSWGASFSKGLRTMGKKNDENKLSRNALLTWQHFALR